MISFIALLGCVLSDDSTSTPESTVVLDQDGDGTTFAQGDCNDLDPNISSTATDLFGDGVDQNCDGVDGVDQDGDGQASVASGGLDCDDQDITIYDVDLDGDGESLCDGDCDDGNGLMNHWDQDADGQTSCDGDCDDTNPYIYIGAALNDDLFACMKDKDGDGFGDASLIDGVVSGSDCDDDDYLMNGLDYDSDGQTSCDGDCNDLDATVFTGIAFLEGTLDCMRDRDGDGFGDIAVAAPIVAGSDCNDNSIYLEAADFDGDGYTTCDGDCDDTNALLHLDDFDVDQFTTCDGDCDDTNPLIYPGAAFHDSTTTCMLDEDGDGYGSDEFYFPGTDCNDNNATYTPNDADGDGYSTCTGDCDDTNNRTFPGAAFVDFPSQCKLDNDLDGFASLAAGGTDCNDFDPLMNPIQTDYLGDNLDANCDGHDGMDADGDGQASLFSGGVDCNDSDLLIHDLDLDGDGHGICSGDCDDGSAVYNLQDLDNDGYTTCNGDCDDTDHNMYPGAAELDSLTGCLRDADDDGYGDIFAFNVGSDCDDSDSMMNQSDADLDGFTSCAGDCQDDDPSIFPIMQNGVAVCLAPEIEVSISNPQVDTGLGCPQTIPFIIENVGDADLSVSDITLSDETVFAIDLLSDLNGALPWVIPPNSFRSGFINTADTTAGTYITSLQVVSDAVYQPNYSEAMSLDIASMPSVQATYMAGPSAPQHFTFVMDPSMSSPQQEDVLTVVEGLILALSTMNHQSEFSFVFSDSGCIEQGPLDVVAVQTLDLSTILSPGASLDPLTALNQFVVEMDGGCNAGLLSLGAEVIPILLDGNSETTASNILQDVPTTLNDAGIQTVVLFHDVNSTCSGVAQNTVATTLSSSILVEGDICQVQRSIFETLPDLSTVSHDVLPMSERLWSPSLQVNYNGVAVSNGWTLNEQALQFPAGLVDGTSVQVQYSLQAECP